MVGFTMFQHVDARLQQIMRIKKPFGGISVIVLGDFNQLRPVGDKYIFQFNNSYNALVDNPLYNIAKGTMTLEDINLLKSRIVSTENLEMIEDALMIFRSNAEVDAYNTKVLASLNTEGATANAYDFCVGDELASIKEKVLSNVKNLKTTETYGLPLKIDLKVGANRSTKASGLYLIGGFVPPKPPEHNDSVAMMFKTMRSERMIKFSLQFPEESQGERFSVIFHNVQSLNKNILDVKSDKAFLSASMISLVETWTKPSDSLEIEGLKVVHRCDCNDIRKPFDQITYLKNHLKYESIAERCEYSGKNHIEYSSIKIDDICIISVYNSPNSPFDVLKRHINEVITVSKRFCEKIIVVGDFNINLKIKTNYKFIEYVKSFGLTLINKLNKNSTKAKTQIDYCFANVNGWKCDYFESLTSFHKPLWIRKHEIDSQLHVDENEQIRTDMPLNLGDLCINDCSDVMDIDDQSSFEQTHTDISFNLKELKTGGLCASTIFDEKSPIEAYEIVDLNTRRILDHFLLVLGSNNTTGIDQISSQALIINDLIEKSPFITVANKDQSVRLKLKAEYSVQAFDSVYARTRTTGDGNCLYSSLSIINIGSEKLTHSMRLLAVNAMINSRDYFEKLCKLLHYSFEEQLKRTAMNTIWAGEVQIQALSIALFHPIYSYM
ncbi:unnamed protein product [Rotaria socialis]|uniref:ATP-dependent DNA helicase n=3 Tax=Rotaria socialis TaxID=392032 RepID=A0A817YHS6_9BILA|nr:unnamed protein product [Rotaria socialis]